MRINWAARSLDSDQEPRYSEPCSPDVVCQSSHPEPLPCLVNRGGCQAAEFVSGQRACQGGEVLTVNNIRKNADFGNAKYASLGSV
jgi:hypothetical protein